MYCFIILIHFTSSFLPTRSFFIPYAYVSIKSIDCILWSPFEHKAILSISSVKTLCCSLLNLCCVFNISFLAFMYFLIFFKKSTTNYFFLNDLFYFLMELLLNSFYNLLISVFFLWHTFLSFFFFYLHHCCLLNSYVFSLLIQQILSWFVYLNHRALIQLLFYFFL